MDWPRQCQNCQNTSYINPLPVAVALIPVKGRGVLGVRRGIEPRKGPVALPGGFIDVGESWQEACAREVLEEINITIDPSKITLLTALSAPDGTLLVMGVAPEVDEDSLPEFQPNAETMERVIITEEEPLELAFPLHTQAVKAFFNKA